MIRRFADDYIHFTYVLDKQLRRLPLVSESLRSYRCYRPRREMLLGSSGDRAYINQMQSRPREDVMAWTGNACQVYDIGTDDLERHIAAHDPLVTAWRDDATTVYGTDLRGLLRDLGRRVTV